MSCCVVKCYICIILNSLLFFLFIPGLPQTKLGNYLETRVNEYLKRQSHPESGEVTIRVVHVSDKVVEVKPGMKSRWGTVQNFMLSVPKSKTLKEIFALFLLIWSIIVIYYETRQCSISLHAVIHLFTQWFCHWRSSSCCIVGCSRYLNCWMPVLFWYHLLYILLFINN